MQLWDALECSFQEFADRPALTHPDGHCLSYRELFSEVNNLSAQLRPLIPKGSRVAVMDEEPFDEAIPILCLMGFEAVIIPMAYKYGRQRCAQIIQHTKPHFLYSTTGKCLTPELNEACASVGTTILTQASIDSSNQTPIDSIAASFIMYTSGSTGKPKGALLSYANILANIADIQTYFEVTSTDHILINRSLSHASVLTGEFLYGLICGARLTFYNEAYMPRRLLSYMEVHQVTIFCTTPTIFYQLALDKAEYRMLRLKKVALMGEYLHKQISLKISERFPHVQFYMLYGQTEASPRITHLAPKYFAEKESCIGTPLPSIQIQIVDDTGQALGIGEKGELLVKGPNIFSGYWDAPELTSSKLKQGWLYTGDVVYKGEDGLLYIAGRKDDMIIRAGMNIYPKEIEDALLEDDRIREIIVFGTNDIYFGQRLNITVVPFLDKQLNEADIVDLCRHKLATYQYPDKVNIVEEIPRNMAGKTMRTQIV
jgi:acyl-CoA synthetase (AMP-forming)/AMP-acid ligase II